MKHTPSEVKIYVTDDYTRFIFKAGNRAINTKKCDRIIADIKSGNDWLKYNPIQVEEMTNGKLGILDGQNRFYIDKKLKRPVYYIIVEGQKEMADVARVNSNVEKWSRKDYVNCYAQQKNKHYIQLQQFLDKYGFNVGMSIQILYYGSLGSVSGTKEVTQKYEKGTFEIRFMKEATQLAETLKKFEAFPYWRDRSFAAAILKVQKAELVQIDDLIEAFQKYPDLLTKQHSHKAYITNLEVLINHKKQKRIVIV